MSERSICLYCTEGSADKEYHVELRAQTHGWMVYYANGPRGRVGVFKPRKPVDQTVSLEEANQIFEALVTSKKKQNPPYTEAQSGVRLTTSQSGERFSGVLLQQPIAIDSVKADRLNNDDDYAGQQKANGRRCALAIGPEGVQGINKRGYFVGIPETWVSQFQVFGRALFDGERVGETLFVFDLLELNGCDLRQLPFHRRYQMLVEVMNNAGDAISSMVLLKAAFTSDEKKALLASMAEMGCEGLVYKRLDGTYQSVRSVDSFKFPFFESATCLVLQQNDQRSVLMGLQNSAGTILEVGNVTIPANFPVPEVGDLGDVRYMYYNPGGAFEQAVYLGPNTEALPGEALLSQVSRLKPGVLMDGLGNHTKSTEAIELENAFELCAERAPSKSKRMPR